MSYVAAFGLRGILCMHFVYFCGPVITGEIHNWVVRKISTGKERTDCSVSLCLCLSLSLSVCLCLSVPVCLSLSLSTHTRTYLSITYPVL